MHAYGHKGGVKIDGLMTVDALHRQAWMRLPDAETLLRQLPVAIKEAELQAIQQLSLVFPGEDAA